MLPENVTPPISSGADSSDCASAGAASINNTKQAKNVFNATSRKLSHAVKRGNRCRTLNLSYSQAAVCGTSSPSRNFRGTTNPKHLEKLFTDQKWRDCSTQKNTGNNANLLVEQLRGCLLGYKPFSRKFGARGPVPFKILSSPQTAERLGTR